jgi:hypothetical protein
MAGGPKMSLNEAQLYNLHSSSDCYCDDYRNDALRMMVRHLHLSHGMGPLKIMQELGVPIKEVRKFMPEIRKEDGK